MEQLRDSDRWAAFLDFAHAFHANSLNNLLLILSQRLDASRVAEFRTWQNLRRQVRKGKKAIRIFGYSTKKVTEEDEKGDNVEKLVARFPILSVFDIGQTQRIDGVQDTSTLTAQLTGADDFGIMDALSSHVAEEGWTVELRPIHGSKNGYTDPEEMTIVIVADLSRASSASPTIQSSTSSPAD